MLNQEYATGVRLLDEEEQLVALQAHLKTLEDASTGASFAEHEELRHRKTREMLAKFREGVLESVTVLGEHVEKGLNAVLEGAREMGVDMDEVDFIDTGIKRRISISMGGNPKPAKRRRTEAEPSESVVTPKKKDKRQKPPAKTAGKKKRARPAQVTVRAAPNRPKKRTRTTVAPDVTPRIQKARALDQDAKEYEVDSSYDETRHTAGRKGKFYPKTGRNAIFQHDYAEGLPHTASVEERLASLCTFFGWVGFARQCGNVLGQEFVAKQIFFLGDKENQLDEVSEKMVNRWSCELKRQKNGNDMDRAVFFDGTHPFVACAWDDTDYTWMSLIDGEEMEIHDSKWDEMKVMLPYKTVKS